jgi:hypothetical protein
VEIGNLLSLVELEEEAVLARPKVDRAMHAGRSGRLDNARRGPGGSEALLGGGGWPLLREQPLRSHESAATTNVSTLASVH